MCYAHIFCGWSKRLKPNESKALSGSRCTDCRATQTLLRSFALYTRHIESALATTYQRYQDGVVRDHIHVAE